MDEGVMGAFWSYAHADDEADNARIVMLARHVEEEYALITGNRLQVFVDRNLKWGDEWRTRIDEALTVTTYFIPIITPRYFKHLECRRELEEFHHRTQSLGRGELLLPILYAPVINFDTSNEDELVRLVSQYQWVDWTELRLLEFTASAYRAKVHDLARRIVDNNSAFTFTPPQRPDVSKMAVDNSVGLIELHDELAGLLPPWVNAIEVGMITTAQYYATAELLSPRLASLEGRPEQTTLKYALLHTIAREVSVLAERQLQTARVYANCANRMDVILNQIFCLIQQNDPDAIELFAALWHALEVAESAMALSDETAERHGQLRTSEWARERRNANQLMPKLANTLEEFDVLINDANALLYRWLAERDLIFKK